MYNIIAEYIWIGGEGELRSKAKTIISISESISFDELPDWDFDGSSTKQAEQSDSEIILRPVSMYSCPFRKNKNLLVMCDTYDQTGNPLQNNNRFNANKLFNKDLEQKPWYGIEQEYFIMDKSGLPVGFPKQEGSKQGKYYCGVGSENVFCRKLVDKHYDYCLYSGLSISGINAEVAPGQWEYQIGPVEGISAGDQLYISRYILIRLSEEFDYVINFEPKPLDGDWNGSGCHVNFSTENIRNGKGLMSGLYNIKTCIEKLKHKHSEHMKVYGNDNFKRMSGEHETSDFNKFSFGNGNRGCSVRIPNKVIKEGKGYFEDRRPGSNMDPYLVSGIIFETCCL